MKKITCIQNYVIDKLIEDEKLSTNGLLDAVSKVCSEEQFNNILSILIETPIPCTNMPELESKISLVRMSMYVPEGVSGSTKMEIIKILKNQFGLSLRQTKEYVDSCIGKYNTFTKFVAQEDVNTIAEKLEPYNVIISTAGFY
ncbi:MAG: Ribosomal protein L7/L12 C-terminal domain [Bacteriophage sp.]|nr:MAG: Ribosomal protein L7/L12 C-terminal domain [Bacteriophage sp.]